MNILLLVFVLLVWGMNWPLMKIAMNYIPPLWFGFTRMSIGCVFLFLLGAIIFEPHPVIHWTTFSILLNFYIGTFATGLAFWGAVEISQRFPAVTTSLSLTGVPIIGIMCSLLFLGEKPTPAVLISLPYSLSV